MKKLFAYFSKAEIILWSTSVLFIVLSFCVFDRESYLTLFASLIGVTSLIFNAKGNPIGQALMIAFSLLYGIISYTFAYYGEMITYLGMTMPMAAFALISWIRNPYKGNKAEVKVNSIGKAEQCFMWLLTVIITVVFYFILEHFNTANIIPSTISVTTSFLAVYLTFRRCPTFALAYNNSETNESYASIDTQNAFIFLPQKPHKNYKTVDNYINLVYGLAKSKNMTVIIPGHTAGKVIDTDGNYDIQETTDTEYLRNKTIFKIGPNQELELDFKNYDTSIYYNSTGEIDDYNDTSLCCVMTFGSNRIGFFGDIDYTAQKQLTGKIGHLDLMNVEHHGLNSGYYRPFFDSIAPKTCFTQDGYKDAVRGTLYLAERCKTHAYLQENGIPNFATSINETMVFNIYKTGITTNANAVKYAININGYSSYMGSINNTTAATTADIGLATLLKNMEHGTLVSTMINKNDNGSKLWADLLEGLTEDTVKVSELIVYKGGSSYHNQSMNGSSDAGYIILIPHTSNPLSGPIMTHWYTTDEYKSIKFVLKPLTNKSHFKCVKEANYTGLSTEVYDCDFLTTRQLTEDEKKSFGLNGAGYIFVPDNACTVNYTVYFRNLNSESVTVKYYDGDSKKSVSIPSKSGITIPNYAVLSTDLTSNNKLTIPEINGVYVKVCGYITYSKTTPKTTLKHPTSDVYPTFNTYPEF